MNLLEFANPTAIWTALLALPIIGLYILKLRLRRQTVSTFLFWNQLFEENKPRAWWQRLRHWLSLLLQLAFLGLLVAALLDPLWSWQRQTQRRVVLIVDNSASMQAIESDGRPRLAHARQSAATLIRSLRNRDRMAILAAGGKPSVVLGMTDHQRSLLSAVNDLAATDGPTAVGDAIDVATRLLDEDESQNREIIVVTDGCIANDEVTQRNDVTFIGVGESQDNVGITQFQVRRNLVDPTTYQILVEVSNFSDQPVTCRVEFTLEDELADVVPLDLEPNQSTTRILDHTAIGGGRLMARLDHADGLEVDNMAVAVLPALRRIPVFLVSEGNLFVESVFRSMQLVDLQVVSSPPTTVAAESIVVFDKQVPETLRTRRTIVIDPQGDCGIWKLGDPISDPLVAWTADSPITKHVRLDNVLLPKSRLIEFTTDFEPLLKGPMEQPLMARVRRVGGDVVVLTGSLDEGDLPLRIAFPVLMKNTVEWFLGESHETLRTAATGDLVSIRTTPTQGPVAPATLPSGEETEDGDLAVVESARVPSQPMWQLVSPSLRQIPIAVSGERATIGPLLEAGVWLARPTKPKVPVENQLRNQQSPLSADAFVDPNHVPVACNLANAVESDLRPRIPLASAQPIQQIAFGGYSLWIYLTLLATGLITTEWWLYQRRIVG